VIAAEVPEDAPSVASDGARAADARLMLADALSALRDLPVEQREALVLVTIEGMSYRDAADILQIPIGTLTSRIARARETLAPLAPGDYAIEVTAGGAIQVTGFRVVP